MRWLPALFFHGSNAKQFEHWYPFYRWTLTQEGDAPACLQEHEDAVELLGPEHSMTCKNLINCIYNNTKEIDKADMSSALVLLGLTPAVIGQIGPTIHNKAQLCYQNPILGFLCVLGAPAIAFGMPWAKTDPREPTGGNTFVSGERWFFNWMFCRPTQTPTQQDKTQKPSIWLRSLKYSIHLLKYLLAAGAAVNVFLNAWSLGDQTIVSWKCTSSYLELIWVGTTLGPIFFAVVGYSMEESECTWSKSTPWGLGARFSYSLSNIGGAVHVLFGTLTFSSVLFIGTLDALGVVGRLTASALVCQFITALELERVEDEREEERANKRKKSEVTVAEGMTCGSC
ncbi:hypothetical protein N7517_000095 [Penicillium concentricum]|uniref:Uncharacterized protein n=1 Tax=Penicillium concentricum TaxID=293559 RepID=A0A9W9SQW4_9EURO|nr:uncharacterized protein N7517_000095 [Penicillium concentricum]KAJ5382184.1 hypothetical protein N7517_000095 [Penicillium concentricum]